VAHLCKKLFCENLGTFLDFAWFYNVFALKNLIREVVAWWSIILENLPEFKQLLSEHPDLAKDILTDVKEYCKKA
jgi:hypothetical protein